MSEKAGWEFQSAFWFFGLFSEGLQRHKDIDL